MIGLSVEHPWRFRFEFATSNHSPQKNVREIRDASSRSGKIIGHKRAVVIQWPQISTQLVCSCDVGEFHQTLAIYLGRMFYPKRPENGQNELIRNWRSTVSVTMKFFPRNLCHSKPIGLVQKDHSNGIFTLDRI